MRRLITIGLLCLSAEAALAKPDVAVERRYSRMFDRCLNSGDAINGALYAMRQCTIDEIERQDAKLNQAYRMLMMRLSSKNKEKLRSSERAWIKSRDKKCASEIDEVNGGREEYLFRDACILYETVSRTIRLENYPR
jgi:uncharacterized protein YecT (DUF1311 family)